MSWNKITVYIQVEKLNSRLKQLKRTLEESEEECARLMGQKRKTQRDLEEQQEHNEVIQRDLDQLKGRLRGGGPTSTDKPGAGYDWGGVYVLFGFWPIDNMLTNWYYIVSFRSQNLPPFPHKNS